MLVKAYEESHPWIAFDATDVNDLSPQTWMMLGQAQKICTHMAITPLSPDFASHLYEVTLIRGARATTAIEGNTLTEEQVTGIHHGDYSAPPSRAYQEREVKNVLDVLNDIDNQAMDGKLPPVTADLIGNYNRRILEGTSHGDDTTPGSIRRHSVVVGNYRGAPPQDCPYLVDRLAKWLESDTFRNSDPTLSFALVVAQAVYAHLYISWIHPYGDGNGRTARMLEFMLLARSGKMPLMAAHLLSNYYNLTRDMYYRELEIASRNQSAKGFLVYAIQGFLDGLNELSFEAILHQIQVAWADHVNLTMSKLPTSRATTRQRALVLAMPHNKIVPRTEIPELTTELARLYAVTGPRTLSRDINKLAEVGLIEKHRGGCKIKDDVMWSYMAPTAFPEH